MIGTRISVDATGCIACTLCKQSKPATTDHFIRCRGNRIGLSRRCRDCALAYTAKWRAAHAAALKQRRRELYLERHKPMAAARREARRLVAPFRHRADLLRSGILERARKRGVPVDADVLTAKHIAAWLERQRTCECCGVGLRVGVKGSLGVKCDQSASIDRLNPALGYVVGNVYLLCWRCNNLKRDASAVELRRIADWMDQTAPSKRMA